MANQTYTFPTQEKAEKFLEENDFVWSSQNTSCDHADGRQASIVDYGHKVVVTIW